MNNILQVDNQNNKARYNEMYPAKVWLFTLLIGFVVELLAFPIFYESGVMGGFEFAMLSLFFAAILSLPSLAIYAGLFYLLKNEISNAYILKIILFVFTILSILLTFEFIFGKFMTNFATIYIVSNFVSMLIVKIKKNHE